MKLLASILFVALLVSLTGCKKDVGPSPTTPSVDATAAKDSEAAKQEETKKQEEKVKREKLLEAIKEYRNSEKRLKAGENPAYQTAWSTIIEAKEDGIKELKKELEKVSLTGEEDIPFETAASLLLFEIGGLDEAAAVAEIWNRIPHTVNYNGVFGAALKAARTKDPRALPMLKACLTSQEGSVFIIFAGMKLFWPTTHEVLWGIYGPGGLKPLLETLKKSKNTVVQKSAVRILAAAGYIDALSEVRRLSKHGLGAVRLEAIRALGTFGHPADYDTLMAGLSSDRPDDIITSIYSLLNFEDLRATEAIIPFTTSENDRIKKAALSTIAYLLTPEAVQSLNKCSKKEKDKDTKIVCKGYLDLSLKKMGVSLKKFQKKSKDEKKELVARVHQMKEESYLAKPDDQQLTREQFTQTLEEWKKNQSIQGGTLDWVRSRHIIKIASPEDIDALLLLRAALQSLIAKNSFTEVGFVNEMIKHVSRRRYRTPTGISSNVAPI